MNKIALYGNFTENMLEALKSKCPTDFELFYVKAGQDIAALSHADFMINRGGSVDEAVINAAPNLKFIQKWGVGYDKIDLKYSGKKGIPVSICVGGNSMPVAELTVTLMLAVLRNIEPLALRMKNGEWAREQFSGRSYLLHGKTVGLVGIGNIAKKVATIVKRGFDCNVLYYDIFRMPPEQEAELGIGYVDLKKLMSESDIVSIHVPLLESTAEMINAEMLNMMKPTSCIINTSRGGVIEEKALIEVLKNGKILGAGLDTYATEPLNSDSELLNLDCVVTTPHCGGNTVDNDINMAAICMDNIAQYSAVGDKTMRSIVNREFLN